MSNYNIMKRREKVLDYISRYNVSPLIFGSVVITGIGTWENRYTIKKISDSEIECIKDCNNNDNLIYTIVTLTRDFCSYISENRIETSRGKLRSSLDIWRHAKYFKPDISIFEIMESLYNNAVRDRRIYTHYCCTVRRRVFKFSYDQPVQYFDREPHQLHCPDEYKIYLTSWRTINQV